ncbi:antitoxin MazE7 [Streptomyces goshikiensis]|uniref:antitoxin MazE7 n=1 Tax=Streptomyces goshikiensis TaxID=1942 RepID=UPI0036A7D1FD
MKTPGEISKSQRVRNPQTAGMSMKDHLARVAEEKEYEQRLDTATAVFRRVIGAPGLLERFDADFGRLPPATAHHTPRTA